MRKAVQGGDSEEFSLSLPKAPSNVANPRAAEDGVTRARGPSPHGTTEDLGRPGRGARETRKVPGESRSVAGPAQAPTGSGDGHPDPSRQEGGAGLASDLHKVGGLQVHPVWEIRSLQTRSG